MHTCLQIVVVATCILAVVGRASAAHVVQTDSTGKGRYGGQAASGASVFSLKDVDGVPRIAVDGKPMVGMAAMPKPNTGKAATDVMRDFDALGVRFFTEHFGGSNRNYKWWLGEGKYDFKAFDALVRELLDASPTGFIFPRVDMNPPRWWKIANPCDIVWDNRRNWVKGGSKPWRRLCRRMLEDVVHHVENSPYADRVMGYHLSAMHGGEWQTWSWPKEDEPPIEWEDERDPLPPLLATEARRAYARQRNRDVADSILMASELVKNLTGGRKLVGVFFGYMATGDHEDFARVVRSPHIDFIASPGEYYVRRGGQSGRFQMSWPASCRLHGKLYYDEADIKTCLVKEMDHNKKSRCTTIDESVGAIRRNLGYALTGGWELWWFMIESNETFRDEKMMSSIRLGLAEMRETFSSAKWKPADVAVFTSSDEYSTGVFAFHRGNPLRLCCKVDLHYNVLPVAGVAYDSYELADIEDERLPDYKVYVFPNAFTLSEERREAIKRKVRRAGKTAIWLYAPGYYRNGEGSAANIEELTGVRVKENYPVKSRLLTHTFTVDGDYAFGTNGWRSVYLASPKVETPDVAWDIGELRKVFADAGAHIWTDTPEVVAAGRGYLMVHAASEGEKTVRLPSRCDVKEVYGARPPLKSVTEFRDVFKKGETRIYRLREKGNSLFR